MSAAEQAQAFAELRSQQVFARIVVCTGIDQATGIAEFDVNGGKQFARIFGMPPTIGHSAVLVYFSGIPLCFGPGWRAPWGLVAEEPEDGKVAITGDDGNLYRIPYADSLDLEIGDRVATDWSSSVVIAEPASEVVELDPVLPGGSTGEVKTWNFYPIDSGSFGSSWFNNRVYCSDSNIGCYFYEGIADSIPDSATILEVWLYLDAVQVSGGAPTIGLHNLAAKSGAPSVVSASPIPPGSGDWLLPTALGDALKVGAQRGIATNHGGYHIYSPKDVNNSGRLQIKARL